MCIHASLTYKTLFPCLKWNSLFREDADLRLTDTASPAGPVYFPKGSGSVFMRHSPCNQSLLCSRVKNPDHIHHCSCPQMTLIPNCAFTAHCQWQQQSLKGSGCFSELLGCSVPPESCSLPRYMVPHPSSTAQGTSGPGLGTRFAPNAFSLLFHSL